MGVKYELCKRFEVALGAHFPMDVFLMLKPETCVISEAKCVFCFNGQV